jgi:hypothetical protein
MSSEEESWEVIQLSEEIYQKLEAKLAELMEKGETLKNGKPIKETNDVITYLLDKYEEQHGKLPVTGAP